MPTPKDFDRVVSIARKASTPATGWKQLLSYANTRTKQPLASLAKLDLGEDAALVRQQLERIWKEAPIPRKVTFLYFGLFDLVVGRKVEAGYYISGGRDFDPDNGDSLCDLPYFPDHRFLKSEVLNLIKSEGAARKELTAFLDYAVTLGAAGLFTKFALGELSQKYQLVVGFDSGDFCWLNEH